MDRVESLREAAALAWRVAPNSCRPVAAGEEDCSWNHGLWLTLRLLGFLTAPEHHAEVYRAGLAPLAAEAKVLVSAAADHGMLAEVLTAMEGRDARGSVVDICETPLALARWHAGKRGAAIETERADILSFQSAASFDAVCTHSFLGQFPPAARRRLVRRWHALLRPGGRVVTVNRLRPGAPAEARVGFSEAQAAAFVRNVLEAARGREAELPVHGAALERAAHRYAARQGAWPIGSAAELRRLFEDAGFREVRVDGAPESGLARRHAVSGPTTPGSAQYAAIVAVRD
jgi:SAM-dependent methyltransferase